MIDLFNWYLKKPMKQKHIIYFISNYFNMYHYKYIKNNNDLIIKLKNDMKKIKSNS